MLAVKCKLNSVIWSSTCQIVVGSARLNITQHRQETVNGPAKFFISQIFIFVISTIFTIYFTKRP